MVAGGAGYIGSHTAYQLLEHDHIVTVVDNLCNGFRWAVPKRAQFFVGDVMDSNFIAQVVAKNKIEAVIYFAAHLDAAESVLNPVKYYKNNVSTFIHFFETCANAGIKNFIFSSSAAVYGNVDGAATEESTIDPINPYGRTKAMAESILKDLSSAMNFSFVILRYFNVAGAHPDGLTGQSTPNATHLIKVACEAAVGLRKGVTIFGTDYPTPDGTGVRDYIHVHDLAQVHCLSLEYLAAGKNSDVFNCGYGQGYSARQVVNTIRRISGQDFMVCDGPRRGGDAAMVIADPSKLKRRLGWVPELNDIELICKHSLLWEINGARPSNGRDFVRVADSFHKRVDVKDA